MHSPIEPGSPTLSTPSSGSDVEDLTLSPSTSTLSTDPNTLGFTNALGVTLSSVISSSTKRRLNPGSRSGRDARDSKSRRKDAPAHYPGKGHIVGDGDREKQGMRGGGYDMQKEKREKEEMIDMNVVEYLRKEIGDPFLETKFE
ncbi:hypothetical protein EV361DRAFT_921839 [Lentinula raphanica]|uniref:Uncharacterized protein n=1 Tax=Lentinula raphanica TaxID=153919 RepID=A0AA38P6B6_9AGAR|nr:hypothetical protein F5880DRAFT_719869 [Lentinula raphanica]KAJ3836996.1 hypothetical protein F5878DRAFT_662483 [Lentinula raphanica]KAJ3969282.1 hypothetical protein EV361DRAFT_921839 [Lentinula raphanica]